MQSLNQHVVTILKDTQDKWRASTVGWRPEKPNDPHCNKGHTVEWNAPKFSEMTLWFPDKKLFGHTDLYIPQGGMRKMEVRGDIGKYPYAIYFVEGSKPIIVEGEDSAPIIMID